MFSELRVAQMAAFLLQRRGGRMSYMKTIKLLYLADKEYMSRYAESMTGDYMVSMDHGPVLSKTYNLIVLGRSEEWNSWINSETNREISLKNNFNRDDLDELSDIDLEILNSVFSKYGHMKRFEIVDFTHDEKNCPEWEFPNGSSLPIKPESIFRAVGKNEKQIIVFLEHYKNLKQLDEARKLLYK